MSVSCTTNYGGVCSRSIKNAQNPMPIKLMQLSSTGISPYGQSNGLSLPSASILALNPNHHHPSRATGTGTQPMEEEELALARKLEEKVSHPWE